MMLAVLDRSDSWVGTYAVQKLETASMRDVDAPLLVAAIP